MFPGTSCYPLSPMKGNGDPEGSQVENTDQLIKILKKLGHQSDADTAFITDQEPLKYFVQVHQSRKLNPGHSFNEMFPKTSPGLIQLLDMMLQFNPLFRPTAKECMKLPVFDSIRPNTIPEPTSKIKIKEEEREDLALNYDEWFDRGKFGEINHVNIFKQLVIDQIKELREAASLG